jgi:hypothetical protein
MVPMTLGAVSFRLWRFFAELAFPSAKALNSAVYLEWKPQSHTQPARHRKLPPLFGASEIMLLDLTDGMMERTVQIIDPIRYKASNTQWDFSVRPRECALLDPYPCACQSIKETVQQRRWFS